MKYIGITACVTILATVPAHAETLSAYASLCAWNLGLTTIPGYSCSQGTAVGSSGLIIGTANNRLGRIATSNPNVDAVFLCRDYNSANNTASLNGYILQNSITGFTCFFDAKNNGSATVSAPTASNAGSYWDPPSAIDGECQTCHSADPFIVTPGLAGAMKSQGMNRMGRNLRGAYTIVGSTDPASHFYNWDAERQIVTSGCMETCHNTSSTSTSENMVSAAIGNNWMSQPNYVPSTETAANIGVWRPGAIGYFYLDRNGNRAWNAGDESGAFGTTGDRPVVLRGTDCAAGRNVAEFGTVRGYTWLITNNNHYWDAADAANTFDYGSASGKQSSWNGVAVSLEPAGQFWVDYNNGKSGIQDVTYTFGMTNDKAVVGRWKRGIGHRMGVYRTSGSDGWWALDMNGNNVWDSGDLSVQFGAATDLPFVGDFNGDGIDEIGTFRDGSWFVDLNNNFQWNGAAGGDAEWYFGQAGDLPVVSPAKWNCAW